MTSDTRQALRALVTAAWQAQCVRVAAEMDLPAHLAAGPVGSVQLAASCGAHEPSMRRLLRALTAMDVLATDDQDRYTLTSLGRSLATLGPWARYTAEDPAWSAWACLSHAIRTGQPAFPHVHGMASWAYHATHPDADARFQAAMAATTTGTAAAIATSHDFSRYPVIADVGGGRGTLIAEVLRHHASARGVLADLPHVIEQTRPALADAGLLDRCDLHGGDFFTSLPAADVYLLKSVLHDWDDDEAEQILASCRRASRPASKLLIIERILPDKVTPADLEALLTDLNMLVLLGGKERTRTEFTELLGRAGYRLGQITPTPTEFSIIEATRADHDDTQTDE
jgi:O-methyltransferase domain